MSALQHLARLTSLYRRRFLATGGSLLVLFAAAIPRMVCAQDAPPVVYLGVVIDDLGNSLREGRRVIALSAPVACAILPHTPFAQRLSAEAHAARKEVLLHLPMQSIREDEAPGPGVLDTDMGETELDYTLDYDLSTVPHAIGVNNHMGSRLTQEPVPMRWLMQALRRRSPLFFLDSKTSPHSVAARTAAELGVPTLERSVFLDNELSEADIRGRLDEAIAIARRHGSAIAIGHPHPRTLTVLEQQLPKLAETHVHVVSLAELLERRSHMRGTAFSAGPGLRRPQVSNAQ